MTELSNLCGLAQVRAVKKSCHAALVFSHGSGAPVILRVRADAKKDLQDRCGLAVRVAEEVCERSVKDLAT